MEPLLGAAAPKDASASYIIEGDQKSFMADVIEASRQIPVLVDFWAIWCGPCKTLTPALEKAVKAAGGRVRLVKIDIDKNRALVQQLTQLGLPLQSVPTVAAFWQGQIADLFQGALPESELKKFIEALLKLAGGAMPSADLITEAKLAADEGRWEDAAQFYSDALQQDAEKPEAWAGLIRSLHQLGEDDQAADALAQVPAKIADHAEIASVRSAIQLAAEGRKAASQLKQLEARVAADDSDYQARYDLATALNSLDRRAEAADALLAIIKADRGWNGDGARLQLLKFFEAWGVADPVSLSARRKLSTILFN